MLDLESIVAEETAENDLEEVVMGLIINSAGTQRRMRRLSRLSRATSLPRNHDGAVPYGVKRSASGADEAYRKRPRRREDESESGAGTCAGSSDDPMLARELVAELIELHEKMQ